MWNEIFDNIVDMQSAGPLDIDAFMSALEERVDEVQPAESEDR